MFVHADCGCVGLRIDEAGYICIIDCNWPRMIKFDWYGSDRLSGPEPIAIQGHGVLRPYDLDNLNDSAKVQTLTRKIHMLLHDGRKMDQLRELLK
jgi:hypothetical protein